MAHALAAEAALLGAAARKQRHAPPRPAPAHAACSGAAEGAWLLLDCSPGRRAALAGQLAGLGLFLSWAQGAQAKELRPKRRPKVPEEDYKEGPQGLKYYDVVLGKGGEAQPKTRVVVHYEARWKGVTFMTSRQGMGVTGGEPLGFDVGAEGAGGTLKGLDLGVRGMRIGGQRLLIVPPELAYGAKGRGEIPPNATLNFTVELLSIKQNPFGYQTKLVEG